MELCGSLRAISAALFAFVFYTSFAHAQEGSAQTVIPSKNIQETDSMSPFLLNASLGGSFAIEDDLAIANVGTYGLQTTMGGDLILGEQFAVSVIGGLNGFVEGKAGPLKDAFVAGGFKMFFTADQAGSLTEGGSALGNMWLDIHLGYHRYRKENHGGIDAGLGYAFALARELYLGPYARIQFTPFGDGLKFGMISIGMRISLGGKRGLADRDGDNIEVSADRCPSEREIVNGVDDKDGCPDTRP